MTIASEISRLQTAKSCIKSSIENKGVTVGSSLTLDDYSDCIDAIPSGGGGLSGPEGAIDLLIIGGGGGGGRGYSYSCAGGGGGAGGTTLCENYHICPGCYNVIIGTGGAAQSKGGNTIFDCITMEGGGCGGSYCSAGGSGGSAGGGSVNDGGYTDPTNIMYGSAGGHQSTMCPYYSSTGGGGGGAGGAGGIGGGTRDGRNDPTGIAPGRGGKGRCFDIEGELKWYAGGGPGEWAGYNEGGSFGICDCGYGCPGSGGKGGGESGCNGLVVLRYLADNSCGIYCATGGTKYTCGDYIIHKFTSNDTFNILYGLYIDKDNILLDTIGGTSQITPTKIGITGDVTRTSSDTSIATVDSTGLVTCVYPGNCTITATCKGYSKTCSITYTPVTGITLDKKRIGLDTVGATAQLTATVSPNDAAIKDVIWTSSDTSIATVDQTGLVTCVSPGDCTITATTKDLGFTATCGVLEITSYDFDFLLIGGGGGGGASGNSRYGGGGGGAGGFLECFNHPLERLVDYCITIGNGGGGGGGSSTDGGDGGNSIIHSSYDEDVIAYGGGGGGNGNAYYPGHPGGSGGGAGAFCNHNGGAGCPGQGCNGGTGNSGARGAGGGGGAGADGETGYNGTGSAGGKGGIGKCSCMSGDCCWYSGGGGGGSYKASITAAGGQGGGGSAGNAANYYGGGGGGMNGTYYGSAGYQGIFILRYPKTCGYSVEGGNCKYECGDYCIHCFTSSGSLIIS